MTLTEFLTARTGEDEAYGDALAARQAERGWTSEDDAWDEAGPMGVSEWAAMQWGARVLREVDAKRKILGDYERIRRERKAHPGDLALAGALLTLGGVLRNLAAVYCDHPDFDPAWA